MPGKALKAARDRAGLTQQQAAEALGIQQNTVARWENNVRAVSLAQMKRLALLYGIELAELVDAKLMAGQADAAPAPKRADGFASPTAGWAAPPVAALPRNLPVLGSAAAGSVNIPSLSGEISVERIEIGLHDVIDYVRRPGNWQDAVGVYAIYITGTSMEPRHDPGDLVYVDPRRPPAPGDDVVVQLRDGDGHDGDDQVVGAIIKRLVRRTAGGIELQQYNPPLTFTLPHAQIRAIHRAVRTVELMGI